VRFSGAATATIPAGRDRLSDPVKLTFHQFQELAISVTVTGAIVHPIEHFNTRQTNYLSPAGSGNLAASVSAAGFTTKLPSRGWYFLDGLEVSAPARTGAMVAFGDSITDGFQGQKSPLVEELSTINTNGRYPDDLQRRITAAGIPLSVLNAGISGNRLLQGPPGIFGPSGLARFRADGLAEPGVTDVIVLEGINDIGQTPGITARQIINGYKQLIHQAHAAHIAIQLGTLTPSGGTIMASYGDPAANTLRTAVNHWIRTQRLSNGIIDFDAAVRDPAHPSRIDPRYDGSDHLHFSLAGYRAMAQAVGRKLLRTRRT
jgi:lysophospholipase L1-like esterase